MSVKVNSYGLVSKIECISQQFFQLVHLLLFFLIIVIEATVLRSIINMPLG